MTLPVEMLSHTTSLLTQAKAFKVARLCCPMQVQNLNSTAVSVKELRKSAFLDNGNIVANLVRELPDYRAAADGAVRANEEEKLAWWEAHSDTLPHWAGVVIKEVVAHPAKSSIC